MVAALLRSVIVALLLSAPVAIASAANTPDEEASFVVGFREMPDEARNGRYADEAVARIDDALGFAVVNAKNARGFEERAARDPNVRYVQREVFAEADWTPNDPYFAQQFAWARVNAPAAWDVSRGNANVIVAVIDTGVERTHPDLVGSLLPGYDYFQGDADVSDDCGHGTGVAGVIGSAANNGVGVAGAAGVSVLPYRALGINADGRCYGPFSAVASSIRAATDNGARVISMSLGCVGCYDQPTNDAIEYASSRGVLLVASSGNNGPCTNCVAWPAAHAKVMAVGCTDSANAQCTFSSGGPEVDLVAPGKSVYTTYRNGAYGIMSGTSLSAPHVSGAAGLAFSVNPALTGSQVWAKLTGTAKDLAAAGKDDGTGYGLLDMAALVASAGTAPPPPAPNQAPSASFTTSATDLAVSVNGGASTDADGTIATYRWSWGDGLTFDSGNCATANHTYAAAGTYIITLTVTDNAGATSSTTRSVTVTAPAPPPPPPPAPAPTQNMHAGDITALAKKTGRSESLTWNVPIVATNGAPVAGATVTATIAGSTYTAITSSTGVAIFKITATRVVGELWTLCVSNATLSGWTYDAAANVETCQSVRSV